MIDHPTVPIFHQWLEMMANLEPTSLRSFSVMQDPEACTMSIEATFEVAKRLLCQVCGGTGSTNNDGGALSKRECESCKGQGWMLE